MSETAWRDVTQDCLRDEGGERWLRAIDDECFITVLHRMTGFGYMEWETFIVFRADTLLIRGDWRDELAEMPKERLRSWYDENISGNRNGLETILELAAARAEITKLTKQRDGAVGELHLRRDQVLSLQSKLEARLAALESSRSVQPATQTAAAAANDPVREGEPQTLPPRETWPAHIRSRDEATAEPPASDGPGDGWRFVNVGERVERLDECYIDGEWRKVSRCGHLATAWFENFYRRRITPAESVPDDAGRRLVAGEPMTVAEMRHAIGVARQEIVRLVSEVAAERVNSNRALESLWKCRDELNERRAESQRDGQEIARLTAERDAANKQVNRLRLTDEERGILSDASEAAVAYGNGYEAGVIQGIVERKK